MNSQNHPYYTDTELLERFYQLNDNSVLGELLQRYTLLLLGVCMKYLKNEESAKDAVQQIFLKAISEMNKYQVVYVKSWLYMIAKNHCLMQLRKKSILIPVTEAHSAQWQENDLLALKEKENTLYLLEIALTELKPEQKTCVTLFFLEKKSYQEIVEVTGVEH